MVVFGSLLREDSFHVKKIERISSFLSLASELRSLCRDVVVLESIDGPTPLAEYSFLAFNPEAVVEVPANSSSLRVSVDGEEVEELDGDVFENLRRITRGGVNFSTTPRLAGGAIGFVSYEAASMWYTYEGVTKPLPFPLMRFGLFREILVHEHRTGMTYLCSLGEPANSEVVKEALREASYHDGDVDTSLSYTSPVDELGEEGFVKNVEKAKEYIESGDVFQVVLSRRLRMEIAGDLLLFYKALRKINPSPYMFLIRLGDTELAGASPEMLVRVEGGKAVTFPIAGTRRRLMDSRADVESDGELLSDEKELAEHVMLVDLARNDLGRVCVPGTVNVAEFKKIVKYSHVKHLVSRVEGYLKTGRDSFDAFVSVFPAGTVSGAPKLRAMEIIDELEPVARGPYAGAVGYFSFNGCSDFAITIRTLFRKGSTAYIQAGAGIVWNSVPVREYHETEAKLSALMTALKEATER